jgi:hypothetical protein
MMPGFAASRHETKDERSEVNCLDRTSNRTETIMRKTALTIFGALLISGMSDQMALASDHHGRKAHYGRAYDQSDFRRAYNQVNGPIDATPRALYRTDTDGFGLRGADPSWVGGKDPSLNPSGS